MRNTVNLAPLFLMLTVQAGSAENYHSEISFLDIENVDQKDRVEIIPHGFTERIGRLVSSDESVCTATLIGERWIITADHCTENEDLKTRSPDDFIFYAGYSKENYIAKSQITRIITLDTTSASASIVLEKNKDIKFSFNDIAIMELEKPIGKDLGYEKIRYEPLPKLPKGEQFKALQIGYNHEYGTIQSADIHCQLGPHFLTPYVLSSSCKASFRDSGSPQFVWIENEDNGKVERQIVGITSQKVATGSMATPTYESYIIRDFKLSND